MDESTLTAWMQGVSVELGEQLKNARNSTSRRLVTDAQNLVRERYMEPDLSLDTICSVLGVSNSYFSSVFKKETGKAFITYLTDYRMDHAATLILETNEKAIRLLSEWDIWMRIISVMYSRNDLACHRRSTGHSIRISKKKIGEMD